MEGRISLGLCGRSAVGLEVFRQLVRQGAVGGVEPQKSCLGGQREDRQSVRVEKEGSKALFLVVSDQGNCDRAGAVIGDHALLRPGKKIAQVRTVSGGLEQGQDGLEFLLAWVYGVHCVGVKG